MTAPENAAAWLGVGFGCLVALFVIGWLVAVSLMSYAEWKDKRSKK